MLHCVISVYIDVSGASDTATLDFAFDNTNTANRNWEIKATQVSCFAIDK